MAVNRHLKYITLELIESGSFKGNATVPAFSEELKEFTFESAAGSPIDCTVEYGEETNTLTWMPTTLATPGFAGLPEALNQKLMAEIQEGMTAGKVTGKPINEATEALQSFSGIYAFVANPENPTTVTDLHVGYDFGISRLTFVDGGKNILVEVSLSSTASDAPDFLVAPILAVNGKSLPSQPLTPEEIAKRKLSAPTGKAVRWFLIPYSTLSKTGNLVFTVSANPPQTN